jgi:hypothetical protein
MRKIPRHRNGSSQLPPKRVLRLCQETVRALTSDELPKVVSGCPTTSWPTVATKGVDSSEC